MTTKMRTDAQWVNESEKNRLLKSKHAMWQKGENRRKEFVVAMRETRDIQQSCARVGVAYGTYKKWRTTYREFATEVDMLRLAPHEMAVGFNGTFAEFRLKYFGMESTWFHLLIVDALENAKPGSITVILMPPEHGKTTLLEDYCSYKLAIDPNYRIAFGSGKQSHSRKALRRVMNRMDPAGPAKEYVIRFGPFTPQEGSRRMIQQAWNADYFDVFKRREFDERDYNMVALGMGSQIQGSRTDKLIVDDPQSLKTLSQTDSLVDNFRQDWLSRPGSQGSTVCVGTRVGDWDFWQALYEADIIDNLICIPAWNEEKGWLWPERYSPEDYEKKKKQVGPIAWARNYMQDPVSSGEETFSDEILEKAFAPMRSVHMDPPMRDFSVPISISQDPSIGGKNATLAAALLPDKLYVLDARVDIALKSTNQIAQVAEDFMIRYAIKDRSHLNEHIVETMAFQKGLETDDAFRDLATRYGVRFVGHLTGYNKYDDDLGVAAMVRSFQKEEIVIPWAEDSATRNHMGSLVKELKAWRPNQRGTKLRQDLVMVLWFVWLRWRITRSNAVFDTSQFDTRGLPYKQPLIIVGGRTR